MTTRRRAREIVLQVLYEEDVNPMRDRENAEAFLSSRLLRNKPLIRFATQLWEGVSKQRKLVDDVISDNAANWSIKRMAAIDRNILRLATYEMMFGGMPEPVAINEAIDLAKRFGDRNSGPFVNGVLDRISKSRNETTDAATSPDDSAVPDNEEPEGSEASAASSVAAGAQDLPLDALD